MTTKATTHKKTAEAKAQAAFNLLNQQTPGATDSVAPGSVRGRRQQEPGLDTSRNKLVIKNQAPEGSMLQRSISPTITNEYQPWGPDNRYPDMMLEAIAGSGTASVCTHTKAKFIKADGFGDLDFYQLVINRQGLKVDTLLGLHAPDLAKLDGVAVVLNFNAWGHPCEVLHAPFAQWRPAKEDKADGLVKAAYLLANPKALLRTNSLAKTKAKRYNLYNPQESPAQRIARIEALPGGLAEYPGEMHVYYHKSTGALNHPRPLHDSVVKDMQSEASLKVSKGTDIRNSFSAQTMITEYGTATPSQPKLDADAAKYGEVVGEDGVRLIVQYAQDKESKPDVDSFKTYDAGERYKTDGETLKSDIRNVFLIPTILYGEAIAGKLGGTEDIESACEYVQRFVVNEDQRALELFYREIFQDFWQPGQPAPGVPILPAEPHLPSPGLKKVVSYTIQPLSMLPQQEEEEAPSQEDKVLAKLNSLDAQVANQLIAALPRKYVLKLMGYDEAQIAEMLQEPTPKDATAATAGATPTTNSPTNANPVT